MTVEELNMRIWKLLNSLDSKPLYGHSNKTTYEQFEEWRKYQFTAVANLTYEIITDTRRSTLEECATLCEQTNLPATAKTFRTLSRHQDTKG